MCVLFPCSRIRCFFPFSFDVIVTVVAVVDIYFYCYCMNHYFYLINWSTNVLINQNQINRINSEGDGEREKNLSTDRNGMLSTEIIEMMCEMFSFRNFFFLSPILFWIFSNDTKERRTSKRKHIHFVETEIICIALSNEWMNEWMNLWKKSKFRAKAYKLWAIRLLYIYWMRSLKKLVWTLRYVQSTNRINWKCLNKRKQISFCFSLSCAFCLSFNIYI